MTSAGSSSRRQTIQPTSQRASIEQDPRVHEAQSLLHGYADIDNNADEYEYKDEGIAMTNMEDRRSNAHDSGGDDLKKGGGGGGIAVDALQVHKSTTSGPELLDDHQPGSSGQIGPLAQYRTYKRRWFGWMQLVLLNLVISWDWLTFAAVSSTSAQYFGVSQNAINWLSNAFLFAFCVAAPAVLITLHRGPKHAIIAASVFTLIGNWIRYAGTRRANYGVLMFGQVINGLAQPFVLAAPTTYSDLWFTEGGRTTATAIPSLANPLGGALAQLLSPLWVSKKPEMVSNMVLYVAIISSVASLPSFFIPARPPTAVTASSTVKRPSLLSSCKQLFGNFSFWLIFIPFGTYVGFFNATSSLINQIYEPYGFSEDQAGIGGALLILVGIAASIIISLIVDRTHSYLLIIKLLIPLAAASYLALTFTPATRSLAAPYVVLSVLGASAFSLLPTVLEYVAEFTFPVGPETSSVVLWTAGQLLGALFTIIMVALKDEKGSSSTSPNGGDRPPGNLYRALVFQAVLCCAVAILPLMLGWRRLGLAKEDRKRIVVDGQRDVTVAVES